MRSGRLSDEEKNIIKHLRSKNKSYVEIAIVLNCKKDRVKTYCQENNLSGYKSNNHNNPSNSFDTFINNFNSKFGDSFTYLSGFEGSESTILIECNKCSYQFTRNAQLARKNKSLQCDNCIKIRREVLSMKRDAQNELNNLIKKIKRNVKNDVKKLEVKLNKVDLELEYICDECGEVFTSSRKGIKYCSDKCANRRKNRTKELMRRKNIIDNGNIDKDISLEKLIKRDSNTCYLCGEKCNIDDYTTDEKGSFIVGKSYPSIEHVIPVSKGGTHTWDNIKLAHHYCNTIKSNTCIEIK